MSQRERSEDTELDDEPTVIARAPSQLVEATQRSEATSGPVPRTRSNRPVSSFGPQRDFADDPDADSGIHRPSLYERLVRSGALDEVMEVAAREQSGRQDAAERPAAADLVVSGTDAELLEDASEHLELVEIPEPVRPVPRVFSTPPPLPRNTPMPDLPSVMLGPGASSRADSTERVVLEEITERVLTQSLTPLTSVPSRPPPSTFRVHGAALVVGAWVVAAGSVAWWAWQLPAESEISEQAPPEAVDHEVTPVVTPMAPAVAPPAVAAPEPEPEAPPPAEPPPEARELESVATTPAKAPVAAKPSPAFVRRQAASRAAQQDRLAASAGPSAAAAGEVAAAVVPGAPEAAPAPELSAAEPQAPAPDLPDQPSRDQVVGVMNGLLPALRRCVGDAHGTVRLKLTVRGQGNVSYALITGDFAGTAEGSCLAKAVKAASFPEFSRPSIQIAYPIVL